MKVLKLMYWRIVVACLESEAAAMRQALHDRAGREDWLRISLRAEDVMKELARARAKLRALRADGRKVAAKWRAA
jgi:hypothetical protein